MGRLNLSILGAMSVVAMLGVSNAAQAHGLGCSFDTESRSEVGFEMSFTPKPIGPQGMGLRAGTTSFAAVEFYAGQPEALTVAPNGDARFGVTLAKVPMTLAYGGTWRVNT